MHCIITGVAGFVGSSLADKLLSLGHSVVGIDCFTDYYSKSLKLNNIKNAREHKSFKFIEGDLVELDLKSIVTEADVVFHQAAQAGVRASWGQTFKSYTHNNILGTQCLLEACRAVLTSNPTCPLKRIVYASSSSIYGNAESFPTKESQIPRPVSPYGVSKLAAEHLMQLYSTEFSVPTISLRYFTVFGPRQRPDMAFNRWIRQALRKQPITLYGDGTQSRDFTFISDIVDANIAAATRGKIGSVYNLGGGTQATVNSILEFLAEETGELKIARSERQSGDAKHTSAETVLARQDLGFVPQIGLKEGLRLEIEWMDKMLKSELGKELPLI